jgi:hypothetical protein
MTASNIGNHFFVDEAGDLTLFNKRGRIIVGTEGVSKTFMLGIAEVPDPPAVALALQTLRADLLADPYFKGVPSMRDDARKTALCFHAKDDLAEVRREVFKVIGSLGVRIWVAIRRKAALAAEAKASHGRGIPLRPDGIYDDLVRKLSGGLPDKPGPNSIVFARRGKANRTTALANAIMQQEGREWPHQVVVRFASFAEYAAFEEQGGMNWMLKAMQQAKVATHNPAQPRSSRFAPVVVGSGYPHQFPGLQVVDYYLWAIQRLLERNEDRFFNLLASNFELIMDLDDTRHAADGERYDASNPLTIEKITPATS